MVPENTILVSMDVANIPQEEEINIVCNANTRHSTETKPQALHDYCKERSNLS